MIRIILLAAIFSLFVHQIVLLPVHELEEPQKTIDGKVEVDLEDDYKMEEINKLAMRDETENTKSERLKRQPETSEDTSKGTPAAPTTPAKSAPVVEGTPSGASSNLQISFQKQFCALGITLGILYKMSKY